MSRGRNRRSSRTLAGILLAVFVLAGLIYFLRPSKSSAEQIAAPTPAAQSQASAASADPAPSVSETPAPTPATETPAAGPEAVAIAQSSTPLPPERVEALVHPRPADTFLAAGPATQPAAAAEPPAPEVSTLLSDAARQTTDNPVAARASLNRALLSGRLSGSEERAVREQLNGLNQALVFSRRVVADDPYAFSYNVKSGDVMARIAQVNGVTWELLCRINGMTDPRKLRAGQTLKVLRGPIHAVVRKSTFTMDLYFGSPGGADAMFLASFPVGLGEHDSTPLGTWQAEQGKKVPNPTYFSPRGEGVIEADDPKNPLGEHWIGLIGIDGDAAGRQSYGIHGTIEPDTIGKMASMGCIRLLNEDVQRVFEMLVDGKSTVVVRE